MDYTADHYKKLIIAEMICIDELDWHCKKCPLYGYDNCSGYLNEEIKKIMDEYKEN